MRRSRAIDTARLTDRDECRIGNKGILAEDLIEPVRPIAGEEQGVVLELGQLTHHSQINEQGPRTGNSAVSLLPRKALQRGWEQCRLSVMMVGSRDDDIDHVRAGCAGSIRVVDSGNDTVP